MFLGEIIKDLPEPYMGPILILKRKERFCSYRGPRNRSIVRCRIDYWAEARNFLAEKYAVDISAEEFAHPPVKEILRRMGAPEDILEVKVVKMSV